MECRRLHLYLNVQYVYEDDDLGGCLADWKAQGARGLILLGTEMGERDLGTFLKGGIPLVLLDNYFEAIACDSILINN